MLDKSDNSTLGAATNGQEKILGDSWTTNPLLEEHPRAFAQGNIWIEQLDVKDINV